MIEFNLKEIDVSSCTFYDMLKQSPLAKGRDDSTIEEVAVWLDMNGGSTRAGITEILKAIDNNFHNGKTDRLDDPLRHLSKILRNTRYGASNTQYASNVAFLPELRVQYFSNNALYWIFKIFSETSSLDNALLDKKFIDFAKKVRDSHREKSMKWRKIGSVKLPIPSQIDQQLYEVFAELVDIINQKLTKKSQSLLS